MALNCKPYSYTYNQVKPQKYSVVRLYNWTVLKISPAGAWGQYFVEQTP